jgi:ABC-type Na+ efflux pump permease subunit
MATEESEEPREELGENAIDAVPEYDPELIEAAMERLQGQALGEEEGSELSKDTFNPSTEFQDKTHAEWMGNLLANKESDTMKNLSVQPPKPSKMTYLLVLVAGVMLGIILVAIFSGALFGGGATAHTAAQTYTPPPPTSSSPIINAPFRFMEMFS